MPLSREQRDYCIATAQAALEASERLRASYSFCIPEATDPATTKDKGLNDQKTAVSPTTAQEGPFTLGRASSSSARQTPTLGKSQNCSSSMTGHGNLGGGALVDSPALRRSPRFSGADRSPSPPAMSQHEGQTQDDGARTVRRSARLVEKAANRAKAADEHQGDEDGEAEPIAVPIKGQRRPAPRPRTAQMILKGKFYADKILDVRPDRDVKGGYMYLTSWQGYTDRTWEPSHHFDDPAMVEDFKATLRREGKGWKIGE